jgi:hypothetical protein
MKTVAAFVIAVLLGWSAIALGKDPSPSPVPAADEKPTAAQREQAIAQPQDEQAPTTLRLPLSVINAILSYLQQRPYSEAAPIISAVMACVNAQAPNAKDVSACPTVAKK